MHSPSGVEERVLDHRPRPVLEFGAEAELVVRRARLHGVDDALAVEDGATALAQQSRGGGLDEANRDAAGFALLDQSREDAIDGEHRRMAPSSKDWVASRHVAVMSVNG